MQNSKKDMGQVAAHTRGNRASERNHIDMLMKEYEMFFMMEDESINVLFENFSVIINNLDTIKKYFSEVELVRKILKSLIK
ncbi:hypothetical protein AHAS_Ahas14G0183800 [Arachis hypogaea]